ncbi:putative F-box-like domain superfamily protein [Tanacetum coccineum]|uniref:F-box-like domain superfamily protein n=1 Tax=Tanacetum coccineum TaxID=301880 RepID=A0ABQ5EMN2_9ASTR
MELVRGSRKAFKFASEDVISNMSDDVITNILNRLPLQDAVRTCTLSKDWRSKWTLLNHLIFDEDFYLYLQATHNGNNYGEIISRLLPYFKGAITKFVLYIPGDSVVDVEDINKRVLFVSQKGIQEFTLKNMDETPLELPAYLFSCLKGRVRKLQTGRFLAGCPLLEILKLRSNTDGEIKRDEIEKLGNLKVLILPLYELSLVDAEKRVRTTLSCLKKLRLYEVDFSNAIMVSCVIDLICGFPDLETLLIKATFGDDVPAPAGSSSEVDFSRVTRLKLQKVKFVSVKCPKNEVCLMKSLIACSPFLEKMVINPKSSKLFGDYDGKRKFVRELMLYQASPIMEIIIDSANG